MTSEQNSTITTEQIRALRREAAEVGDSTQVAACDAALAGDDRAREVCADAIDAARAMQAVV